jgi:hypothetical protein
MSNRATHFIVDVTVLDAIGRYLMLRPMSDVEGMVNGLRQAQPYNPKADEEAIVDAELRGAGDAHRTN